MRFLISYLVPLLFGEKGTDWENSQITVWHYVPLQSWEGAPSSGMHSDNGHHWRFDVVFAAWPVHAIQPQIVTALIWDTRDWTSVAQLKTTALSTVWRLHKIGDLWRGRQFIRDHIKLLVGSVCNFAYLLRYRSDREIVWSAHWTSSGDPRLISPFQVVLCISSPLRLMCDSWLSWEVGVNWWYHGPFRSVPWTYDLLLIHSLSS